MIELLNKSSEDTNKGRMFGLLISLMSAIFFLMWGLAFGRILFYRNFVICLGIAGVIAFWRHDHSSEVKVTG